MRGKISDLMVFNSRFDPGSKKKNPGTTDRCRVRIRQF